MNETFDRPNRATGPREVWERESDGKCFAVHPKCCGGSELVYRPMKSDSLGYWGYLDSLPTDRYRIRTIPDSPWPPKVRKEKRWYNVYPAGLPNYPHYHKSKDQADKIGRTNRIGCVELTCEVDENDKVIRVLKEGE